MMLKKLGFLAILLSLLFSAAAPMSAFAQDAAANAPAVAGGDAADDSEAVASGGFFTVLTSGGIVGMLIWILLLLTSLAMVALVIDSFISVNESKVVPISLVSRVQEAMEQGDVIKALNVCNEEPGPMSNILSGAFENVEGGFEAIQDSVAIAADLESERLIQRVNYLNVVGNLAPMLGLLGTVLGMIYAFKNLAGAGAAGASMLANNISLALWTTTVGLLIAIPALAFFYYFRNRANTIILNMEQITLDQIKVLRHVEVVDEDE